ncbi:PAAR domain-containing protein [bacterium]|nr:PAAR domain-containing protein [bacterium]
MPAAARTTDGTTNHTPCGPGKCSTGSSNVIINGLQAFRVGDKDTPHGVPQGSPPSCVPHVTPLRQGSSNVLVNGKPLGRVGDAFFCGIRVASGSGNVIVNG